MNSERDHDPKLTRALKKFGKRRMKEMNEEFRRSQPHQFSSEFEGKMGSMIKTEKKLGTMKVVPIFCFINCTQVLIT